VTVGQTVDGVDEFYKDWRNRKVIFRHAMQYVLDEAQGMDDSQLLLSMRKLIQPSKSLVLLLALTFAHRALCAANLRSGLR